MPRTKERCIREGGLGMLPRGDKGICLRARVECGYNVGVQMSIRGGGGGGCLQARKEAIQGRSKGVAK